MEGIRAMRLAFLCLVAALGGLLFGFDTLVIAGAKPFYEPAFGIDAGSWASGFAMSSAVVGCIVGAIGFMRLPDAFGRKAALFMSAVFFLVGAAGTALAGSIWSFIVYRIMGGVGIGIASNASPLYIAEVSPPERRGALVSLNQLAIVLGIILAQLSNWVVFRTVPDVSLNWRVMFGVGVVPSAAFLALTFAIPESPMWLALRQGGRRCGREGRASVRPYLGVLAVGVFLALYQQWSGINAVLYYAADILKMAEFEISDVMVNQIGVGAVNLIATVAAIFLVDRVGRRRLLLAGAVLLAVFHALLGCSYRFARGGFWTLAALFGVVASFAETLGPVVWVVLSELFPTRVRGTAMSISIAALWLGCYTVTLSFPPISSALGAGGCFWMYAAISVGAFFMIRRFVAETGGRQLE